MDKFHLRPEVLRLIDHFERRGLTEHEALAVMGMAIQSMLKEPERVAEFSSVLRRATLAGKEDRR